jgi:YD repeat-containing protein
MCRFSWPSFPTLCYVRPSKLPLASYAYNLDQVGNRRVLTESVVTVEDLAAGTYLESGGLVVMEAENGQQTGGPTHEWQSLTTQSGYTSTAYLQALPDLDELYQTSEITASPTAAYLVSFATPQTYTVWLRGYPANAAGDSAYLGLGGQVVTVTGFAPGQWTWANQPAAFVVTTTGVYTVNLWMREDGLRIDRLLLTTDTNYVPTGFGPVETAQLTGQQAITSLLTRTIVYTYDNLYRLTDADYSTGEQYEYEYDPVGNRLKQIITAIRPTISTMRPTV